MPAKTTFPILLDDAKQISITKLKEFGYFKADSFQSGQLHWSISGCKIGSINIEVDLRESPKVNLSYTYNKDEPVRYSVRLDSVVSNLGIGKIWYFICPKTDLRCRKLYGAGKYFLHRNAFSDALYDCQTYSKRSRQVNKVCKMINGSEKLWDELYSKHFKSHYAGKPTKRYKQILSELESIRQDKEQAFRMFKQELYR